MFYAVTVDNHHFFHERYTVGELFNGVWQAKHVALCGIVFRQIIPLALGG